MRGRVPLVYIETDVPPGVTLHAWRRARCVRKPRRSRLKWWRRP